MAGCGRGGLGDGGRRGQASAAAELARQQKEWAAASHDKAETRLAQLRLELKEEATRREAELRKRRAAERAAAQSRVEAAERARQEREARARAPAARARQPAGPRAVHASSHAPTSCSTSPAGPGTRTVAAVLTTAEKLPSA